MGVRQAKYNSVRYWYMAFQLDITNIVNANSANTFGQDLSALS